MFKLIVFLLMVLAFFGESLVDESFAHRSGCHRWHSCPSDNGSYKCGDLGHDDYCSNKDSKEVNKDDNDDNAKEQESKNKQASSTIPKSTITEGIELSGSVTYVVDGDTLDVNDVRIRLALVDTPERGEDGYQSAKNFVKELCLGEHAQVDIDDGQRGGDRYGREIGVVYCNGVNVNNELIDKDLAVTYTEYCDISEFANEDWADCSDVSSPARTINNFGSKSDQTSIKNSGQSNCDSSYPDLCIPSPHPDLDCGDISQKRFTVSGSDPHGFDRDGDGVGCES